MNILFQPIAYPKYNNYGSDKTVSAPSFCGKTPQKLIEKLMAAKNLKDIHYTFDEMAKIYDYLGYDVIMKRGSHAVIPITKTANLPLVIPHKDKYVSIMDIRRLKYVLEGDIEKALR